MTEKRREGASNASRKDRKRRDDKREEKKEKKRVNRENENSRLFFSLFPYLLIIQNLPFRSKRAARGKRVQMFAVSASSSRAAVAADLRGLFRDRQGGARPSATATSGFGRRCCCSCSC